SQYRAILLKMRKDLFSQLSDINNQLQTYQHQRVTIVAEFEKRMEQIRKEKQMVLDRLYWQKGEQLKMQQELAKRLEFVEEDINFYRIEREEYLVDRWHLDQDLGLPVGNRPPPRVKVKCSQKGSSNCL
ncbi:MAG: hypothetical protein HQK53_20345, partial [Oligoflexia bacterium]|nr:hypothetical protein [Oligoflexia bacterium]